MRRWACVLQLSSRQHTSTDNLTASPHATLLNRSRPTHFETVRADYIEMRLRVSRRRECNVDSATRQPAARRCLEQTRHVALMRQLKRAPTCRGISRDTCMTLLCGQRAREQARPRLFAIVASCTSQPQERCHARL